MKKAKESPMKTDLPAHVEELKRIAQAYKDAAGDPVAANELGALLHQRALDLEAELEPAPAGEETGAGA